MAEMQEFSPDAPKQVNQTQRKHYALGALAIATLIVSFWSGMQFQKSQTTVQSPAVYTASQSEQWSNQSQTDQTQDSSQLNIQTN